LLTIVCILSAESFAAIDSSEVTNSEYSECVAAGKCKPAHYDYSLGFCFNGKEWVRQIIISEYKAPNVPVTCVDWQQASDYCTWKRKRLPKESEWEKAVRAGTATDYYWGAAMNPDYAWFKENSGMMIKDVKGKKPNSSGLYDMSGNVWEWCSDCFDTLCTQRVFRGGSFVNDSTKMTSSARKGAPPESRYCNNGFRCMDTNH